MYSPEDQVLIIDNVYPVDTMATVNENIFASNLHYGQQENGELIWFTYWDGITP